MSDWDPVAAIEPPAVEIKLFGRWNPDEVLVNDISLQVSGYKRREGERLCHAIDATELTVHFNM